MSKRITKKKKKFLAASISTAVVAAATASAVPAGYAAEHSFSDLPEGSFSHSEVMTLVQSGIINGYPDGTYRPNQTLTREQAAALFMRALNLEAPADGVGFEDVNPLSEYYDDILAVQKAGIFKGSDNEFRPKEKLTREQMATILVRAFQLQEDDSVKVPFTDFSAISPSHKENVKILFQKGVTTGKADNTYAPFEAVKRGQFAVFLYRLLHNSLPQEIESVSNNSVTIDGLEYTLSQDVKEIINNRNKEILLGAKIKFEKENEKKITSITYLELTFSGKPAQPGEKEFSNNLVLDGGDSTIKGNVKVSANYISINNLKIIGNLEISEKLYNDFHSQNIHVEGTTIVNGGDDNTVVFEDATLAQLEVNKKGVRVEPKGKTTLKEMTVNNNATIHSDPSVVIPKITISERVRELELHSKVTSLILTSKEPFTLKGDAQIKDIVLPKGAKASDLIDNYDEVKETISNINGKKNQDVKPSSSSPSSGSSSGDSGSSSNDNNQTSGTIFQETTFETEVVTRDDGSFGHSLYHYVKSDLNLQDFTYTVQSSDETIAAANIEIIEHEEGNDTALIIDLQGKIGSTTISLTATNSEGYSETITVPVKVIDLNFTDETAHRVYLDYFDSTADGFIESQGSTVTVTSELPGKVYLAPATNHFRSPEHLENLVANGQALSNENSAANAIREFDTSPLQGGLYELYLVNDQYGLVENTDRYIYLLDSVEAAKVGTILSSENETALKSNLETYNVIDWGPFNELLVSQQQDILSNLLAQLQGYPEAYKTIYDISMAFESFLYDDNGDGDTTIPDIEGVVLYNPFQDLVSSEYGGGTTIPFENHFEGDIVEYLVESDNTSVAEVNLESNSKSFSISPILHMDETPTGPEHFKTGTATITVTAKSSTGKTITDEFTFTINPAAYWIRQPENPSNQENSFIWNDSSDPAVTEYDIVRSLAPFPDDQSAEIIGTVEKEIQSFIDKTAVPGVSYFYTVKAKVGDTAYDTESSMLQISTYNDQTVTNVASTDIANNMNGSDLKLSFNKAVDETNITTYKILLVKNHKYANLTDALTNEYAIPVPKTGQNLEVTLPADMKDSDGDLIGSDNTAHYKLYVLSVNSDPAQSVISTPVESILSAYTPNDVTSEIPMINDFTITTATDNTRLPLPSNNELNLRNFEIHAASTAEQGYIGDLILSHSSVDKTSNVLTLDWVLANFTQDGNGVLTI